VNKIMRGLGPVFLVGCLLASGGCGADNESEADRLQKATGAPPTSTVKSTSTGPAQASTYEQYTARQKEERSQDPRKSDYAKSVGGAKK